MATHRPSSKEEDWEFFSCSSKNWEVLGHQLHGETHQGEKGGEILRKNM